ncbi:MAG: glucose-6-phosphate dehydrogenase [Acidobacteriota bacterium]
MTFGATGDLMQRKLLPALWNLAAKGWPDRKCLILGTGRSSLGDAGFRRMARDWLALAGLPGAGSGDSAGWREACLFYQPVGAGTPDDYRAMAGRIADLERTHDFPGNRILYLALPPSAFPPTIAGFGQAGLNRSNGWTRIVIEKPFGRDLASARTLNETVHHYFDESQVYRIDHYLGKETVQNLLVFRFANALFESVWNRDRVASVEITVAETLGVEHRAAYYEQAGALRDMVQNHLTQLLTVTAMELPASFDADAIRYEKVKVLAAIRPIGPEDAIFGQYTRGRIDGKEAPGYLEEPGVAPGSQTETFVALKLEIANWRWQGVPFYLRTGKRLPQGVSRIVVTFRCPPISIFQPLQAGTIRGNRLVITLQPDEGFDLQFEVKTPGERIRLEPQSLRFRYAEAFAPLPEAYETLLMDVMLGDRTLFVRDDWVEASWRLYTPLLERRPPTRPYAAGTWGPVEAGSISWAGCFLESGGG